MGERSGAVTEGRRTADPHWRAESQWLRFDTSPMQGARDGLEPAASSGAPALPAGQPPHTDAVHAAGVAHDLCNLLTLILGHAEIAKCDVSEGSPLFKALEEIIHAADMGATLSGRLLSSRVSHAAERRSACLNQAVRAMLSVVQHSLPSGVAVDMRLAPGLWPTRADEAALGQVAMNLFSNARDAMPCGGVLTVATENVCVGKPGEPDAGGPRPGEWVCLTVADTGVGMDAETARRAFEPYFTAKASGTGLGLAIVHGIVTEHGGWITVESAPGRGSVFCVFLPACAPRVPRLPSA